MSRKRKQSYAGCSIEARRGKLRLRFRAVAEIGARYVSRETGLDDTAENRIRLRPMAKLVGAAIQAGRTTKEIDEILGHASAVERVRVPVPANDAGPTVAEYYRRWIKEQEPLVRKAQLRDYRRHIADMVLPTLGPIPLSDLKPSDVRGLQSELLSRNSLRLETPKRLSVKYVKNIISGSFRAMIAQARDDDLVSRDVFGKLKWPEAEPPEPDPLTAEERTRIIDWFNHKRFGFHPGLGSMENRWLPHPHYHAFVVTLFWTGMRPSEAAGLCWGDIDLNGRRLFVRRSRHMYAVSAPKTKQARRTVELFPEVVRVLRTIQTLHVTPEMPVFVNTCGNPIEPKVFSEHWYACLRALGIRQRGIYCTKDTFVTTAFSIGVKIPWLEAQTGVRYETLRRHYGRWVPLDADSELKRFEQLEPALFGSESVKLHPKLSTVGVQFLVSAGNIGEKKVRGGGLEPPRVLPH